MKRTFTDEQRLRKNQLEKERYQRHKEEIAQKRRERYASQTPEELAERNRKRRERYDPERQKVYMQRMREKKRRENSGEESPLT